MWFEGFDGVMMKDYGLVFETKNRFFDIYENFEKITTEKIIEKYFFSENRFIIVVENGDRYNGFMKDYGLRGFRFQGCYVESSLLQDDEYIFYLIIPLLSYHNIDEELRKDCFLSEIVNYNENF